MNKSKNVICVYFFFGVLIIVNPTIFGNFAVYFRYFSVDTKPIVFSFFRWNAIEKYQISWHNSLAVFFSYSPHAMQFSLSLSLIVISNFVWLWLFVWREEKCNGKKIYSTNAFMHNRYFTFIFPLRRCISFAESEATPYLLFLFLIKVKFDVFEVLQLKQQQMRNTDRNGRLADRS